MIMESAVNLRDTGYTARPASCLAGSSMVLITSVVKPY